MNLSAEQHIQSKKRKADQSTYVRRPRSTATFPPHNAAPVATAALGGEVPSQTCSLAYGWLRRPIPRNHPVSQLHSPHVRHRVRQAVCTLPAIAKAPQGIGDGMARAPPTFCFDFPSFLKSARLLIWKTPKNQMCSSALAHYDFGSGCVLFRGCATTIVRHYPIYSLPRPGPATAVRDDRLISPSPCTPSRATFP